MSDYELGEVNRQVANLVRLGTIAQVDEAQARVTVKVSGLETDWIPWTAGRAGKTRRWSMPTPGEQVVIASPYGDLGQAIVLGSVYQDGHPAPANSADHDVTEFPDGTRLDYDSKTNTFTLTVAGAGLVNVICKSATIKASDKITADTPELHVTGKVTSGGDMVAGSISLQEHVHTEQGDGAPTSPPK